MNAKYEITDIAHEKYPFLHRIRALRDIGDKVKAGDLGGFVESRSNLSFEPGDDAWIFGDAIAAGSAIVDQGARLFGKAVACDCAYVSQGAAMSAEARAEDNAYIRGADLCGHAKASGCSMILNSPDTGKAPFLSETCVIYGAVVLDNEKIVNKTPDTLILKGQERSVIRDPSRDELAPRQPQEKQKKSRGRDR